ncbi:hypothetical protein PSEUDO8BK_60166 [Pseudomonas sp. 8BK]|nr:hypothetical protein PSEUDO8BK_60166 [Pseudomonas sp. 8BK]
MFGSLLLCCHERGCSRLAGCLVDFQYAFYGAVIGVVGSCRRLCAGFVSGLLIDGFAPGLGGSPSNSLWRKLERCWVPTP